MKKKHLGIIAITATVILCLVLARMGSFHHSDHSGTSDEASTVSGVLPHKDGWELGEKGVSYYRNHEKVTGWFYVRRATYYFDKAGYMVTGWAKISGKIYYFRDDGKMLGDGWMTDDYGTHYLEADGAAACGKKEIDDQIYLFSDKGVLLKNRWVGNSYAGEDGIMVTDQDIDGLYIDENGERIFEGTFGSGGCLYMPSVGVEVPSYKTAGDEEGQRITDRENCAARLTSFHMPVIADHKNQGFEAIKDCVPGETTAFLLTEKKVRQYRCLAIFTGFNAERDITDQEGVSIDDYDADLCLYTCNEDWKHVTIVLFEKYH